MKTVFLSHLHIQTIILPRQARGKHRKTHHKKDRFSSGIYTLGPQPGSSLQGNHLFHAAIEQPGYGPFGHGGSAMYHDQGSGGFTDTNNVIEGPWDSWTHVRAFGWKCPGAGGREVDCAINVTENFVRSNGTNTCSVRSATCRKVDPGFSVAGNVRLAPGAAFPPTAAAIIAAAGPRHGHR